MKELIEGFLKFQREAFPRRSELFRQLANLQPHPSVRLALEQGRLDLHGWVFDIESGSVDALDGASRCFVPLARFPHVRATRSERDAAVA